jgi:hypothetical protein
LGQRIRRDILPRAIGPNATEGDVKSGLEIAQEAQLHPITDIAAAAGILPEELEPFGRFRAKVALSTLDRLKDRPDGKLANAAVVDHVAASSRTRAAQPGRCGDYVDHISPGC